MATNDAFEKIISHPDMAPERFIAEDPSVRELMKHAQSLDEVFREGTQDDDLRNLFIDQINRAHADFLNQPAQVTGRVFAKTSGAMMMPTEEGTQLGWFTGFRTEMSMDDEGALAHRLVYTFRDTPVPTDDTQPVEYMAYPDEIYVRFPNTASEEHLTRLAEPIISKLAEALPGQDCSFEDAVLALGTLDFFEPDPDSHTLLAYDFAGLWLRELVESKWNPQYAVASIEGHTYRTHLDEPIEEYGMFGLAKPFLAFYPRVPELPELCLIGRSLDDVGAVGDINLRIVPLEAVTSVTDNNQHH